MSRKSSDTRISVEISFMQHDYFISYDVITYPSTFSLLLLNCFKYQSGCNMHANSIELLYVTVGVLALKDLRGNSLGGLIPNGRQWFA